MSIVWFLIIGAVAGWLAGLIMKGPGFGLMVNILVGCVGAILGGWIFSKLGFSYEGLIGSLITALVGALLLLFIFGLIKKK